MHHSASAFVQLSESRGCRCGLGTTRGGGDAVLRNALYLNDERRNASVLARPPPLTSKPHPSHQDFYASTNRISCSVRRDAATQASLCVFFPLLLLHPPSTANPPPPTPLDDADSGNAISPETHGSDSPVLFRPLSKIDCLFQQGCSLEGQGAVLENDYDTTPDHSELEETG